MPTVTVTLPSDNTTAVVAQYNVPITTILSVLNGFLDDANIASLSGTKITAGTIPSTAFDSTSKQGYYTGIAAPNSVTYNGNRSYSMVFNGVDYTSTLYPGTRLKMTRAVAAPTQCTSLNGSTQYYNNTSVNKLAFTNNFVCSAWVKLSSYSATRMTILSRYNGTSGWEFSLLDGTAQVFLQGFNAGSGNRSYVLSNQAIPLNKWVHVVAQLDMATFTASPTTSYVMIDGVDVGATVGRAGTNPTALVQAGNLEVGSQNGGALTFPGKLAQVAVFSAKVTETTMQGYISQGLAGTETSLASAYSFNNSIIDLNTTTPNNLTANGSAVATNADSPFGQNVYGTPTGTTEFGIVQQTTFSTNSTVVVQVPMGCAIPTANGVSAVVYSNVKVPAAFPVSPDIWIVEVLNKSGFTQSTPTVNVWYPTTLNINMPIGAWSDLRVIVDCTGSSNGSSSSSNVYHTLSTSNSSESNPNFTSQGYGQAGGATSVIASLSSSRGRPALITSATTYYSLVRSTLSNMSNVSLSATGTAIIQAQNGYL